MSHITKIIAERHRVDVKAYCRRFQLIGEYPGNGFSFPCTKDGELIKDEHYESRKKNYDYCLAHPEKVEDCGIRDDSYHYMEPTRALCSCGEVLMLDGDTKCPGCGQWYNLSGQALKHPSEWGDGGVY